MDSDDLKIYQSSKSTQNNYINLSEERILCNHCKRTKNNGIACKGICVSDNNY